MPLPSHEPWLPSTKRYFEEQRISSCIPNEFLSKHKLTIKLFWVLKLFCMLELENWRLSLIYNSATNTIGSFLANLFWRQICHIYGSPICKEQPLNGYFIPLETSANVNDDWTYLKYMLQCKSISIVCKVNNMCSMQWLEVWHKYRSSAWYLLWANQDS